MMGGGQGCGPRTCPVTQISPACWSQIRTRHGYVLSTYLVLILSSGYIQSCWLAVTLVGAR